MSTWFIISPLLSIILIESSAPRQDTRSNEVNLFPFSYLIFCYPISRLYKAISNFDLVVVTVIGYRSTVVAEALQLVSFFSWFLAAFVDR